MHGVRRQLEAGQEPHGEDGKEEAEAQVQGQRPHRHQDGQERQLLQLLRPGRASIDTLASYIPLKTVMNAFLGSNSDTSYEGIFMILLWF